jgi:CheY-like chemotaxis protein
MPTVLDIGNCGPDHASLTRMFRQRYGADMLRADQATDALEILRHQPVDLIVVNRKLDVDYSDGIDVIKQIQADAALKAIPVMLITNYAEHQEAAVAIGAQYGFGKLQLEEPSTHQRLSRILAPVSSAASG